MTGNTLLLVIVAGIMFAVLGGVTLLSHIYSLNGIKSKTVGDGQHGTARWATKAEIKKIYKHVPFDPQHWRKQAAKGQTPTGDDGKPLPQGIVVVCTGNTTAMVDTGDVHVLMIGAAGVGKTAFWLYPCIEYACASGISWLSTDTKGDIMRNYGHIAKQYGYNVSVIDLRNPTRSNGNNLLHLVNKYMDLYQAIPDTWSIRQKQKSMQRSYPRPSSYPVWMPLPSDRTPTSTMQPKVCLQRRSCSWLSSVSRRSGTSCQCSRSFRNCWHPHRRKVRISSNSSWRCFPMTIRRNGLPVQL